MTQVDRIQQELLVLRCQQGDSCALDTLLNTWQERLWRHSARLAGDSEAAWDILQETCIAIARDIGRLERPGAFSGWAYRIATNKCRDWLRARQRRRRWEESYAEEAVRSGVEDLPLADKIEEMRDALARLGGPDRALLGLHYEEGFNLEEIAAILGLPNGTVKSRLFYARKRLRTLMEESHDERR